MAILSSHGQLTIDGHLVELSHLNAFRADIPGKGRNGQNLRLVVQFSTHVFSERTTQGRRRDVQDHSGVWRTFCHNRYSVSLLLPKIIGNAVAGDVYTTISRDFNKGSNLILIETVGGECWAVFFCFEPLLEGVVLSVLSIYPKTGNIQGNAKRNKISYFARKCLFNGVRIP